MESKLRRDRPTHCRLLLRLKDARNSSKNALPQERLNRGCSDKLSIVFDNVFDCHATLPRITSLRRLRIPEQARPLDLNLNLVRRLGLLP